MDGTTRVLGVLGADAARMDWLRRIGDEHGFEVSDLLTFDEVRQTEDIDVDALLAEARSRLAARPVDGITTFWDFPSSCLAAILAEEQGLPTPGLRAIVNFEHKYWSRVSQRAVAPEETPAFAHVDVADEAVLDAPPLDYPFWLKPVKSFSGHLGFHVGSDEEYHEAIAELRGGIERLGGPFQAIVDRLEQLPPQLDDQGVTSAIAEGIVDGDQCTLEGYVHGGRTEVHGIFDIHRGDDGSTFTHYTYPSRLPENARERMTAIACDLMAEVGYDDAPFNIEFFVDTATGHTWILEINPRISQEHSHLMRWVDDTSNLPVMALTALGRSPRLGRHEGPSDVAAKFFLRRYEDAIVERVPDRAHIDEVERRYAPCVVELSAEAGDRLSELPEQEPYSFLYGYVHLGGDDHDELEKRRDQVLADLDVRFGDHP